MARYVIGIIDEDDVDVDNIKRSIIINKPEDVIEDNIAFLVYPLDGSAERIPEKLEKQIIEDIIDESVSALIIDYKIVVSSTSIEGTEIFKKIVEQVPLFPVIILSNLPNDCYEKTFVDADKVYAKRYFFKIEEQYSKEKTLNIFRNMDHYTEQRAKLSTQLNEQLIELQKNDYNEELLKQIATTEDKLDKLAPQGKSTIEKKLNFSDLKDAVKLLAKANELLGE